MAGRGKGAAKTNKENVSNEAGTQGQRRSARKNLGDGGHLAQLANIERAQTTKAPRKKTNPALQSQPVNVLAPQAATKSSKPKSPTTDVPNTNQPVMPRHHLANTGERFGFVLPVAKSKQGEAPSHQPQIADEATWAGEEDDERAESHEEDEAMDTEADDQGADEDEENDISNGLGGANCGGDDSPVMDVDDGNLRSSPELGSDAYRKHRRTPASYHTESDEEILPPPRKRHMASRKSPSIDRECTPPAKQHVQRRSLVNRDKAVPSEDQRQVSSSPAPNRRDLSCPNRAQSGAQAPNSRQADDVLHRHQERNGRPTSPDIPRLQQLRQRGAEEDDGDQDEHGEQQDEEDQPIRNNRKGSESRNCLPTQIGYYPSLYKRLLAKAKQRSRLASIDNPFQSREDFLEQALEILTEIQGEFAEKGCGVEDGYWNEHKDDMAILLWDDLGSMRSEFKKAARPIVLRRYKIFSEAEQLRGRAATKHIEDGVRDLLRDGMFLRGGLDDDNRTNNLAHAALEDLCQSYYYLGKHSLARSFPDEFSRSVPKNAVALAATVLSAALQEHKTGTYQRQIFSFETYRDVHVVVEKVIMDIEGDRYHYSKCRRFWRQWARTAMEMMEPQRSPAVDFKAALD